MPSSPLPCCSFIIVNYNGLNYLHSCLESVYRLDYPRDRLDVILVDNGSQDDSLSIVEQEFPEVRCFRNHRNNFAGALNLGIQEAQGDYIAFLNNDAQLDRDWLGKLLPGFKRSPKIGAVAGKIRFLDGRINSVGHRRLRNHYWADIGYGEADQGQYDQPKEVEGLCWAATLFQRSCLQDVGAIDEEFVMYFEDVEYSKRCRDRGWSFQYVPGAIADHQVGGSSTGSVLTEYFCNRNRFLYLAKHEPEHLINALTTSVFWIEQHYDLLYDCLPVILKKLVTENNKTVVNSILPKLCQKLQKIYGARDIDKLLARLEVMLGSRKIRLAIYDNSLHFIGGGQRYLATLAAILQDNFEITLIGNRPIKRDQLEQWYGLDLSRCQIRIIPLPFFDKRGSEIIDSTWVTAETENPFDAIALASKDYDIFINANQVTKVVPLAPVSLFFCHFPDTHREAYFAADRYSFLVSNSDYTSQWIRKRWRLNPTTLLYPPVEMAPKGEPANFKPLNKEKLILAVGRFEPGGMKKQQEMIQAFQRLYSAHPQGMKDWRLVLVGGSSKKNSYLQGLEKQIKQAELPVDLAVNVSLDELRGFYKKAALFWHLCGLEETHPERFEHFGMATVEAMQNGCIPLVFRGGGQPEIVEAGESGFLVESLDELVQMTYNLCCQPETWPPLQEAARRRGDCFSRKRFEEGVWQLFGPIEEEYSQVQLPDPAQMAKRPTLLRELR
ncbi:MAG: glycosyltransferase [Phormidium sp. BM_Day4_Bin.17]|nr:glycosyltransferase [Phormidium sp. BM_Day4_Bin.17]UCJ14109.1 MAG: glycosyltransferase [Phormidium sp. PBR-2020]